ncbi:hypothetical protein TNCT_134181 [Trichonephila clavata]|uniref:Uncharacterized protein n=1 Tax=Trichonephila clavata TaxID=2740835 RepID=A0A8X6KR30_TRICU|nr:hypothetical protein TNCT_134181 [Trichonephila clavata]
MCKHGGEALPPPSIPLQSAFGGVNMKQVKWEKEHLLRVSEPENRQAEAHCSSEIAAYCRIAGWFHQKNHLLSRVFRSFIENYPDFS